MTTTHDSLRSRRIAVVIVVFEAETTIVEVLDRLPATVAGVRPSVLVADDASSDRTADIARSWAERHRDFDVEVRSNAVNLGYGGNQARCYEWAAESGADIVVLLHGDAQYPPEGIDDLVAPLLEGSTVAVYGSRMIRRGGALAGGMPMTRFVGNRVLSVLLNGLAPQHLSEWFSGFRAYRTDALARVDVGTLPPGFDFDTAITLELMRSGGRIEEIAIPTHYGREVSRVPLLRTGLLAIVHGVRSRRTRSAVELLVDRPA